MSKSQQIFLDILKQNQTRLTLGLTNFLLYRFQQSNRVLHSTLDQALLQRWTGLLVESLLYGLEKAQFELVSDFIVVLRSSAGPIFEATLWQSAINWLDCHCQRLLRRSLVQTSPNIVANSALPSEVYELAQDLYQQQWEELMSLISQLEHILRIAGHELKPLPNSKYSLDWTRQPEFAFNPN
jgi:hypothetical protein